MKQNAAVDEFIEELGLVWDRAGANRTIGRILGRLMVCDPPEQSASDLAAALHVSKASVSTATRTLEAMGLVQRVAKRGERRLLYRLPPGAWDSATREGIRELEQISAVAQKGQKALGGCPPEQRGRVDDFAFWAAWMLERYRRLVEEWEQVRR